MCYERDTIVNMIIYITILCLQKGHPKKRYDRRCGFIILSRMAWKAQDSSQGCDLPTVMFKQKHVVKLLQTGIFVWRFQSYNS